jgi:hypothetical protein
MFQGSSAILLPIRLTSAERKDTLFHRSDKPRYDNRGVTSGSFEGQGWES